LGRRVLTAFLATALVDLQVSSTSINLLPSFSYLGPFPFPRLCHRDLASAVTPSSVFTLRRRVSSTASHIALRQATWIHSASSSIRILRHLFGGEPPTGSEDDGLQPVGGKFNFIFGSTVMLRLDGVLDLYKPAHDEATPHHYSDASLTPLQQFTGDLRSSGAFGSRFLSYKGLDVASLLFSDLIYYKRDSWFKPV
jgi:hypothetical protein